MSDTTTQVCNKCTKTLPVTDFKPLASGKGYYKKCNACSGETPAADPVVVAAPTKKPRVTKKEKKEKEIVILLSNFDDSCKNLRAAYAEKNANKILESYTSLNDIHVKLQALTVQE
jgi:hypothetical protein